MAQQIHSEHDGGWHTPKSRVMIVSPGVGASWVRSSGSSLSLVNRVSPASAATPAPPSLWKLLTWRGLKSDSICSKEKMVDFSSTSLEEWWKADRADCCEWKADPLQTRLEWWRLPEDAVDAHDALGLGVATVVNDRSLSFHPDITSVLSQHTILSSHRLTLGAHWRDRDKAKGSKEGRSTCARAFRKPKPHV